MLMRLGLFSEFTAGPSDAPSMLGFVRDAADSQEASLIAYLGMGHVIVDVMARTPDVLDGSPLPETESLVTDGSWVWRADLLHYVRKYHLQLPAKFTAQAEAAGFRVRDFSETELAELTPLALEAWRR
jgi:hypothetical protein